MFDFRKLPSATAFSMRAKRGYTYLHAELLIRLSVCMFYVVLRRIQCRVYP